MTTKYMVVIVTEDERLAKAVYRAYAENEEEAKEEGGTKVSLYEATNPAVPSMMVCIAANGEKAP